MRKGLIGAFGLGRLQGSSDALKKAEEITRQHGVDLEGIFYATAFQSGVDEFLIPKIDEEPVPRSAFLSDRIRYIPKEQSLEHHKIVDRAFSAHLPENWQRNTESGRVWEITAFIVELLDSMSTGAAVLSPFGIPDVAEVQLPSELAAPIVTLIESFDTYQMPSPIAKLSVQTEQVQRFNEILISDLFSNYSSAHLSLEDAERPVTSSLPIVESSGRSVFLRFREMLGLKRSILGTLKLTPKLIDAVFGKLPGAIADVATDLGAGVLEERRRIVIYDFEDSITNVLLDNLVRMFQSAEE